VPDAIERRGAQRGHVLLQPRQHRRHLGAEAVEPAGRALLLRQVAQGPPDQQDVEQPVRQHVPAQRVAPRAAAGRDHPPATRHLVQRLDDREAVVDHLPVRQGEGGDLAQRVGRQRRRLHPAHGGQRRHGLQPLEQAELMRRDHHLADVGRAGGPVEDQIGGHGISFGGQLRSGCPAP